MNLVYLSTLILRAMKKRKNLKFSYLLLKKKETLNKVG